jgi:hypothetical protein
MAADDRECMICLGTSPVPIHSGCACRGDRGLAHIVCLVRTATSQQAQRGIKAWWQCQACKQGFTGAMRTGLAEAWRSRVAGGAVESTERLAAEAYRSHSLSGQGKHADAEVILGKLLTVKQRVLGPEHPSTLVTAGNLARSLSGQGKYADAGRIQREVLRAQKCVLGPEHSRTLRTAGSLAQSLANAEAIQREVRAVQTHVLGPEHPETLMTANNLASSLLGQGKNVEAEVIYRELLGMRKGVLGPEHPSTLVTANNLARSLSGQGKHAETERIHGAVLL